MGGEAYFRTLETNALQTISSNQGQIISCGGGAVLKDENVDILKKNGVIVLLTATPETIFDRVKDHTHRPILNNDMSLRHVKELMEQREPKIPVSSQC
ncbi:MAG: shikimate kinase [Eubacterium sp.]|uniref:shikimate kinase n=1 Tax=Eubacterium sp. TaxID=142586 RepID=UPI00399515FF